MNKPLIEILLSAEKHRMHWQDLLLTHLSTEVSYDFAWNSSSILTWVSVSLSLWESSVLLATDKYLFLVNSASRSLICSAVKAVRGRFFRSSPCFWRSVSSETAKITNKLGYGTMDYGTNRFIWLLLSYSVLNIMHFEIIFQLCHVNWRSTMQTH